MHETDTVHPFDGAAYFGPDAAKDAFAEVGPCRVRVDEGEEVATWDVREDKDVVGWCGEVSEEGGYVRVGYVLDKV